jgi:hypothetical protein
VIDSTVGYLPSAGLAEGFSISVHATLDDVHALAPVPKHTLKGDLERRQVLREAFTQLGPHAAVWPVGALPR